jgi:transposase
LLFEALVLMLAQQMPFAAVARIVGQSAYRCMEVCNRYVKMALGLADFGGVTALAIDETSRARGHAYVTLAADAQARRVTFVTEGRDASIIEALAADLLAYGCRSEQITSVSIDMSPAFIKGVTSELPNAQFAFDKFHVVGHPNAAVDKTRRIEQRTDNSRKGMRWTLLKDVFSLKLEAGVALHGLITTPKLTRTDRAWIYKEQLRELLVSDKPAASLPTTRLCAGRNAEGCRRSAASTAEA